MKHQITKIKFVSRVIDINRNSEMKDNKENILIETKAHKYIGDTLINVGRMSNI